MSNYPTKDSGKREEFSTGARRDTQSGKGRFDLIPPHFLKNLAVALEGPEGQDPNVLLGLSLIPCGALLRLAALYGRGAAKYGPDNWKLGIPLSRSLNSLMRHANNFKEGLDDEDHLAAIAWNAFTVLETRAMAMAGKLPEALIDIGPGAITKVWTWIDGILSGDPQKRVSMIPCGTFNCANFKAADAIMCDECTRDAQDDPDAYK